MQLAYNYINVPSDFATSTLAISGGLFSDFSTVIYVLLGVVIFGLLVAFFLGAFHKH